MDEKSYTIEDIIKTKIYDLAAAFRMERSHRPFVAPW